MGLGREESPGPPLVLSSCCLTFAVSSTWHHPFPYAECLGELPPKWKTQTVHFFLGYDLSISLSGRRLRWVGQMSAPCPDLGKRVDLPMVHLCQGLGHAFPVLTRPCLQSRPPPGISMVSRGPCHPSTIWKHPKHISNQQSSKHLILHLVWKKRLKKNITFQLYPSHTNTRCFYFVEFSHCSINYMLKYHRKVTMMNRSQQE